MWCVGRSPSKLCAVFGVPLHRQVNRRVKSNNANLKAEGIFTNPKELDLSMSLDMPLPIIGPQAPTSTELGG